MRPMTTPRLTRCDCGGELRLKAVECANEGSDLDTQTFVCHRCGRELTLTTTHERMTPRSPAHHNPTHVAPGDEFLLPPRPAPPAVNHPSSNLMTMELNEPTDVDDATASRR